MRKYFKFIAVVIWVVLCVWCFIDFISNEMAFNDGELTELFYLRMGILTFPTGYLTVIIIYLASELFKPFIELNLNGQIGTSVLFLLMTLVGYLQWFILIPLIFRRIFFKKRLNDV